MYLKNACKYRDHILHIMNLWRIAINNDWGWDHLTHAVEIDRGNLQCGADPVEKIDSLMYELEPQYRQNVTSIVNIAT